MKISVYTDGSSSGGSKRPIGWGWVVVVDERQILCSGYGGFASGTNNVAELMAAREGLRALIAHPFYHARNPEDTCELVSDSQYVLGLAAGTSSPSVNVALARHVADICKTYRVQTRWVRGHSGDPLNTICDKLAKYGKEKCEGGVHKPKRNKRRVLTKS